MMKIPEPGMAIEIGVGIFEHVDAKVIGIIKHAEVRKATKHYDHGLYVEFARILYVEEFDDADTEELKTPKLPFYVSKGKWRTVPESRILGKVL